MHPGLSTDGFLWRLHGDTVKDVECFIRRDTSDAVVLTLVRNYETVLREVHVDEESAVSRASEIRDGLLTRGWTFVPT